MAQPIRITGRAFRPKSGAPSTASIAGYANIFDANGVCRLRLTDEGRIVRVLKARLAALGWPTNKLRVYREGELLLCDLGSRVRMEVKDVWAQMQTEPPPRGSRAIGDRLARLTPVLPAAAAEPGKSLS